MIEIYKKKYQTCLEALEQLRIDRPELKDETLSYNGILDPMAEGVLPVLVGDEENKRRGEFTGSKKVYVASVLVGVSTDSSDLLGIVKQSHVDKPIQSDDIVNAFINHDRRFNQIVPMHSNRKVDGKRLWWWILNGIEIPREKRPVNAVEILDINHVTTCEISWLGLKREIDEMGQHMGERFRLGEVISSWHSFFNKKPPDTFVVIDFKLFVTSGFYVRTFIEDIGASLGVPLVMFSLKRTKVIF